MGILAPTPNRVEFTARAAPFDGDWVMTTLTPPPVFYAQMGTPVGGRNTVSPREIYQVWMRYSVDALLEGAPAAGSILNIDGRAFEVCETPKVLTQGTRRVGWELVVVDIELAYPTIAIIQNQAGIDVTIGSIAMWTPRELHDSRGEREDQAAEAPASLYPFLLPRNTRVVVGTHTWAVAECVLDLTSGRTSMRLRNTRGAD